MPSYWAKTPLLRAAMTAHPEAEWILWVDSDAVFTDMEFKLPLDRYKNHNLVVDGWPNLIHEKRSWTGLNAGVLLFRNCQGSMDFINDWASMGPQSPDYEKWGQVLKSTLKDKTYPISDDQSALVYLLRKQEYISGKKIYLESEYCFQCYWARVVNQLDDVAEKYVEIEKRESRLRRRHAEVVSESYGPLGGGPLLHTSQAVSPVAATTTPTMLFETMSSRWTSSIKRTPTLQPLFTSIASKHGQNSLSPEIEKERQKVKLNQGTLGSISIGHETANVNQKLPAPSRVIHCNPKPVTSPAVCIVKFAAIDFPL
ncbi:hypothetical protein RJ639_021488 [Escallonia herrerae]|uniref:Uncharacterized protein n=1 Tax=Escallonia herrerae TaxID=1293975 RepID=A0AA88V5M2_9ASTE|nr:hypothetical protein RJ639_021488 [Escallonia herrerae]